MLSSHQWEEAGIQEEQDLLGDIDAKAVLLSSTDVESQAEIIRCGIEMDNPPPASLRACVRWG